jgi:hypothetical protein
MGNNIFRDSASFFPESAGRKTCSRPCARGLVAGLVISLFGTSVWAQSGSDPKLDRFRKESKEVLKPSGQKSKSGQAQTSGWVIVVGAFTSEDQEEQARKAAQQLALEGSLTGVTVHKRGKTTVLEYGSYPTPDDARAQEDLARVRDLTINGEKPLAEAFLAPPDEVAGTIPEFDLRNAPKNFRGKEKPLYTLQVAVYTRDDDTSPSPKELAEFRKTAEEAASQLRREGEQAFYYHGPNRSMVTIGLFGARDTDPLKPGVESMQLRELRERYKYNLLNGKGIRETRKGTDGRDVTTMQPSFLVAVPKN